MSNVMNRSNDQGHYKTAGSGLLLIGLVNAAVAAYSIVGGSSNAFINYETMFTFAVVFIGVGVWMRTQDD